MELIPILSTIILVATISTFLLAIGAYILYKVRERRGQQSAPPQPATVKAELVSPLQVPQREPEPKPYPQQVYIDASSGQREPIFIPQGQPAPRAYQPRYTSPQQPRQNPSNVRQRGNSGPSNQNSQEKDSKFLKYTSEGYVPAKEDSKNSGALKWR